jgi:hypothetical protein
MLRRGLIVVVVAVAGVALSNREASAQIGGYGVNYGDMLSPYLNLNLMNGAPGLPIYQNLVTPFIQGSQQNLSTAAGINALANQIGGGGGGGAGRFRGTGRHFMYYSHYYSGIRH